MLKFSCSACKVLIQSSSVFINTPTLTISLMCVGALSCLVLQSLARLGATAIPHLFDQHLSPSFYQPDCLSLFSKFVSKDIATDFNKLLTQFNHFESLMLVPELEQACLDHLAHTQNKTEVLKLAVHRLKTGDVCATLQILETFKRDDWPDVYRSR